MMNACMWAVGLEDQITAESSVDILGHFSPSPFYTGGLYREGVTPQSLAGFDSAIMPSDSLYNGIIDSPGKSDSRYAKVFKNRPNLLEKIRVVHPNMSLNFKEKKAPKNKK